MSLLDDFEKRRRAGQEADAAEFFADPDAEIPDAEYRYPDCPICGRGLEAPDGDQLVCEVCQVRWALDGTHGERMDDAVSAEALGGRVIDGGLESFLDRATPSELRQDRQDLLDLERAERLS